MSNSDFIKKPLGSAFPSHGTMGEVVEAGMSLRDYFAAKALNSILLQDEIGIQANRPTGYYDAGVDETCAELWARNAYEIADAMLKARDNG